MPDSVPSPGAAPDLGVLPRLVAVYHRTLLDTPEAGAWLHQHGLSDVNLWTRHQLGFANGSLLELLPSSGPVLENLKTLGVLLRDGREYLVGCLVIPVMDLGGRILNLWGYPMKREVPALSLPGRPMGIWNLVALQASRQVNIVESVLEALSAHAAGHVNTIALQHLEPEDIERFREQGVQRVTVFAKDLVRGQELIVGGQLPFLTCAYRRLPEEGSLSAYLIRHGPEPLAGWLAGSGRSSEANAGGIVETSPEGFAVQLGSRRYEIRGLQKGPRQLRATVRVERAGRLHVDTLDFYAARWRRQLCRDLCRVFEEPTDVVEADLSKLVTCCEAQASVQVVATPAADVPAPMTDEDRAQAEALGKRPDLIEGILSDFEQCGLVNEQANKLLCYLAMTSRKLDKPLAVLILSSSGAGKTVLQDTALRFCPPEDLVKVTTLSTRVLFYKAPSSLKHKVLAVEEGDGLGESTYALRNLISAGELSVQATMKEAVTGKMVAVENRVEGPAAVFLTTTKPDTDPETKSRFWVTSMDESRFQTQAILIRQRQQQTLGGLTRHASLVAILTRHWNFQRLLRPLAVVNPFAEQLTFGDDRLQGRRDQPKYLNLIRAVTLLRQMQKPVQQCPIQGQTFEYIEVDREDVHLANRLAAQLMGHSLDELSRPAFDLLMQLEQMTAGDKGGFTRRQIRQHTGWTHARVHRYLRELLTLEYVVLESCSRGQLQTYRLVYQGEGKGGEKFLLGLRSVEELREPDRCTSIAPGFQGCCTARKVCKSYGSKN